MQITNISNERGDMTTDTSGIRKIVKKYYE